MPPRRDTRRPVDWQKLCRRSIAARAGLGCCQGSRLRSLGQVFDQLVPLGPRLSVSAEVFHPALAVDAVREPVEWIVRFLGVNLRQDLPAMFEVSWGTSRCFQAQI